MAGNVVVRSIGFSQSRHITNSLVKSDLKKSMKPTEHTLKNRPRKKDKSATLLLTKTNTTLKNQAYPTRKLPAEPQSAAQALEVHWGVAWMGRWCQPPRSLSSVVKIQTTQSSAVAFWMTHSFLPQDNGGGMKSSLVT